MKGRFLSLTAVFGALGTSLCCVGPVIFSLLGLSSFASLWLLQRVVPYRNWWFAATFVALGLGWASAWRRRTKVWSLDFTILVVATSVVLALLAYTFSLENWPGV